MYYFKFFSLNFQLAFILIIFSLKNTNAISSIKNTNNVQNVNKTSLKNCITAFGLDLLKTIQKEVGNVVNILLSPLSTYLVLALLWLGAGGQSRSKLAAVMKLPENGSSVSQISNELGEIERNITNAPEGASWKIKLCNGIFLQEGDNIKPSYLKQVKADYNANVKTLDFVHGDEATNCINNWINNCTEGQIPKFYSEPLDPTTKIILTSTVYLAYPWVNKFPISNTKIEKFNTSIEEIDVEMMRDVHSVPYHVNHDLKFRSIILDLEGDLCMVFILPDNSQSLQNLTNHLNSEDIQRLCNETNQFLVDYKIPHLKFLFSTSFNEPLSSMGLETLFQKINLTNMVDQNKLKISQIKFYAKISANETEVVEVAVTSTSVTSQVVILPPPNIIKFYLNQPFMFLTCSRSTGVILFSSLVYKPTM